jgi:hypothetical protein
MRVIDSVDGTIVASDYSDLTRLTVEVRLSNCEIFCTRFLEDLGGRGELGRTG